MDPISATVAVRDLADLLSRVTGYPLNYVRDEIEHALRTSGRGRNRTVATTLCGMLEGAGRPAAAYAALRGIFPEADDAWCAGRAAGQFRDPVEAWGASPGAEDGDPALVATHLEAVGRPLTAHARMALLGRMEARDAEVAA